MLHAIDEYEAGRLSSEQVERFIDFHIQGLERIGLQEIHESRRLCYRLVRAHYDVGEDEFIKVQQVPVVVAELRRFLRSLPNGPDSEPGTAADGGT
ncbi:MAG: hypothetical protein ACJ8C4_02930 [Gemmataceae bacterium]